MLIFDVWNGRSRHNFTYHNIETVVNNVIKLFREVKYLKIN